MSSRTGGWFPFGGLDVDTGGYGGRDGLPSRGAPTALGSWVLVLTVGRGWRGDVQAGRRAWVPYGSATDLSAWPTLLFTLHSLLCTGFLTTGCCPPAGV